MKLLTLSLENFQGLKKESFRFDGKNGILFGNNATGKSTVNNAFTWLLFDKAANGAKNYTPKTKSKDGDMHYLNHATEGVFELSDGQILTLKKVYHEVYKTKRGSANEEFSGHTTDYYIDGVPSSEKEYSKTILQICGEPEQTKVLTMPHYFPEDMSWSDRRKILIDVCGDVSDDDVIQSSPELKGLPGFLLKPGTKDQHYTVDEYKKIAMAKKSDISKQRQDIPGRIDELERSMPDVKGIDVAKVNAKIKALEDERREHETKRAQLISGDTVISEVRAKIADTSVKLAEARAEHLEKSSRGNNGIYDEIHKLKKEQNNIEIELGGIKSDISTKTFELERLIDLRAKTYDWYIKEQNVVWNDAKENCPTCKRPLPNADVQKLKEEFNLKKSKKLEEVNDYGRQFASKEMISDAEKIKIALCEKADRLEEKLKKYDTSIKDLQRLIKVSTPFESTDLYKSITQEISDLREKEKDSYATLGSLAEEQTAKVKALSEQIKDHEQDISFVEYAKKLSVRINELETLDKDLLCQFEKLEQGIYLCEVFTKTKVSMLDDKINGKFSQVRFRLFIEQQNGGIKEDCEVMIPTPDGKMVPFTFANSAARMNAGLEIIDTLSKHWGLTLPVFIDNAEGVQKLIHMDTQIIQTVVPLAWDKLDQDTRDVYLGKYGSSAEGEYSKKYNKLVLETN